MKKIITTVFIVISLFSITFCLFKPKENEETNLLQATVLEITNDTLTIQDNKNVIYTFNAENMNVLAGDNIILEYTGLIDKNENIQTNKIISYEVKEVSLDDNGIPTEWLDNGIFKDYYIMANNKLNELTLDEKIGQILLVRYPDNNQIEDLKKYKFSGFIFFEKDFKDKTKEDVITLMNNLQNNANIPLLTAVDEEGGKVVRISSNPNLVDSPFKSSQELYSTNGFEAIKQDTIIKSNLLKELGLNLNLAPVVDVSTNSNDYIYPRTLGQNTSLTSEYAKTVISASKGTGVSYTLKHFPGYGNNIDTHTNISVDNRTYDSIISNDIPPFQTGINAGAEAVLVGHNIVNSIDPDNPASLSPSIHNLLRNELGFTGIIMTDDLNMDAVASINTSTVDAILSGNDLIITTNYEKSVTDIKNAINDGTISEELINKLAFRVLSWKYYKGLMLEK